MNNIKLQLEDILDSRIEEANKLIKQYKDIGGILTFDKFIKSEQYKKFNILLQEIKYDIANNYIGEKFKTAKEVYPLFFSALKKGFPQEAKGVVGYRMLFDELALKYGVQTIKEKKVPTQGSSKLEPDAVASTKSKDFEEWNKEFNLDDIGNEIKTNDLAKEFVTSMFKNIKEFTRKSTEEKVQIIEEFFNMRNELNEEEKEIANEQFKSFAKQLPTEQRKELNSILREVKERKIINKK